MTAASDLTVRPLQTPAEMRAGVELYRRVLELAATDPAVSPRLLWALRRNGGSVMGAFAGERLVGFAYGFLGMDPASGELYHYSQATVVDNDWQGRGVGRALKLGQREHVLATTGVTRMRWSYDPVRAANGHFNLDVLGARARWFVRNLYGVDDMGRDAGHPSDRLIVDWNLTGEPSPAATGRTPSHTPDWGETTVDGDDSFIGVPRVWSTVAADHERAARVRAAVSAAFEKAMAAQYVAVSCQVADDESAWYHLRRTDDVRPGVGGAGASARETGTNAASRP